MIASLCAAVHWPHKDSLYFNAGSMDKRSTGKAIDYRLLIGFDCCKFQAKEEGKRRGEWGGERGEVH